LAQRRLARDWLEIYGANEYAAGTGDPFFCEAVSAHHPVFLRSGGFSLLPVPPRAMYGAHLKKQATYLC